ncbi:MAG TPA: serine hydrolase domain-containing protein, partial [Longimicrobiales bacterium]|nr:serine hydrolase domain-containing protein [Longimicrobiales bacterium]
MPRNPAATALTALALAAAPSPALVGQTASLPPGFEGAWQDIVDGWRATNEAEGIVGSSVAFVADGRIVARAQYGLADRERDRPVDEETIYHWASITKTFTAVSIMQLRDRGLLTLDDPVVKYV